MKLFLRRLLPIFIALFITAAFTGCKMHLYTWPLSYFGSTSVKVEQAVFQYRVPITVDNSDSGESFTDFPVLVKLDGTEDVTMSRLDSGFHDLRFYTGDLEHRLSFEVEKWDPEGGECLIWVKVPSIEAGADPAATFYMYYDYEGSESLPEDYPSDVWTDNFLGVWHLNEGESGPYEDSSPHGSDGVGGSSYGFDDPSSATGYIGGGQKLPNTSDSAIVVEGLNDSSHLRPVTFSLWLNGENTVDGVRLLHKGDSTDSRIEVYSSGNTGIKLGTEIYYTSTNQKLVMSNALAGATNTWIWHVFSWNGTKPANGIRYYKNGTYGSSSSQTQDGAGDYLGDAATAFTIGNDGDPGDATGGQTGIYDEVRVSSVVRSDDWIAAQHASMTDAYLTFGAEEDISN